MEYTEIILLEFLRYTKIILFLRYTEILFENLMYTEIHTHTWGILKSMPKIEDTEITSVGRGLQVYWE